MHKSLRPEVKSIVLDAEAVAYDKDKKKILPFQVSRVLPTRPGQIGFPLPHGF